MFAQPTGHQFVQLSEFIHVVEHAREARLNSSHSRLKSTTLSLSLPVAQGISALGYELGVGMGTQESPEVITEVGAAFWYGFALG